MKKILTKNSFLVDLNSNEDMQSDYNTDPTPLSFIYNLT